MKKKILSLLAAFFMLFGTSAMAQVDSTLEGDVNGDGVVDIADITAVIAIIKQNAEANPTYYWYVGKDSSDKLITTENYKQYSQTVTNYQPTQTLTVDNEYIYVVVLADKTVEAIDQAGGPATWQYLRGSDNRYIPVATDATILTLDDGKQYRIWRSNGSLDDKYTINIK